MPENQYELLTLNEAADELRLAPNTLRLQIANGRLQAIKRGRQWFVTRSEIERYRVESLGRPGRPVTLNEASE